MRALYIGAALLLSGCVTGPPSFPLEAMRNQTVVVHVHDGHGTGVVVGNRTVLTARHVSAGNDLTVETADGLKVSGKVVWQHETNDLSLIETDADLGIQPARLDCSPPKWGESVAMVGHPQSGRWVLAMGHVATTVPFDAKDAEQQVAIQLPANLGQSGGPVFDESGRLRGVIAAFVLTVLRVHPALPPSYSQSGVGLMSSAHLFCPALLAARPELGS